jgi:hypothetical protein
MATHTLVVDQLDALYPEIVKAAVDAKTAANTVAMKSYRSHDGTPPRKDYVMPHVLTTWGPWVDKFECVWQRYKTSILSNEDSIVADWKLDMDKCAAECGCADVGHICCGRGITRGQEERAENWRHWGGLLSIVSNQYTTTKDKAEAKAKAKAKAKAEADAIIVTRDPLGHNERELRLKSAEARAKKANIRGIQQCKDTSVDPSTWSIEKAEKISAMWCE